jgi:hypothetical protein
MHGERRLLRQARRSNCVERARISGFIAHATTIAGTADQAIAAFSSFLRFLKQDPKA